jgi:CBS domain-containing membrane protein
MQLLLPIDWWQHSSGTIALGEKIKVSLAALITLFFVTFISQIVLEPYASAVLLASMGASAVIIFALPSSPLGKPWNFIVSHSLGCIVGFGITHLIGDLALMAGLSVAVILMLMYTLDCMHPPAAATALVPVIASQSGQVSYWIFVAVALNVIIFLAASVLLNRVLLNRARINNKDPYDPIHLHKDHTPLQRLGIQPDDLRRAIHSFDTILDVNEADLERVYQQAQQHAYQRRSGELLSRDIMSKDIISVSKETTLTNAWTLLRKHKFSMLPVVNDQQELMGVISTVDFLKHISSPNYSGLLGHLNSMLSARKHGRQVNRLVEDLMTTDVTVVKDIDHIVALVPLLSIVGLHHIPVLNDQQKLCGIITQSDLISALYSVNTNV